MFKFVCLLGFVVCVNSLALPSYLKACKYKSPDFTKCAIAAANAAIPVVANGDKKYQVPSAKPYKIVLVNMDNNNFKFRLKDLDISGIEDLKTTDLQMDFDKKHMEITISKAPLTFKAKYDIDGKIVLPIVGNGDALINIDDPIIKIITDYKLVKKSDGKEYFEVVDPKCILEFNKAHVKLDNLFNGDKKLGDQMNKVLNDNWDILKEDLSLPISKALESIALSFINGYFGHIPFDNIFTK